MSGRNSPGEDKGKSTGLNSEPGVPKTIEQSAVPAAIKPNEPTVIHRSAEVAEQQEASDSGDQVESAENNELPDKDPTQ
ncbi:MAG: hypothetical protein ACPIA7_00460 [Akkermansiaceae bacterium]